MATFRSFTGYFNVDLTNPSSGNSLGENITTGEQFDLSTTTAPVLNIVVQDNNGDIDIGGDSIPGNTNTETPDDSDQFVFIEDSTGVIVDGEQFYLELVFTYSLDSDPGTIYTGYTLEAQPSGLDFTIFPSDAPLGPATVQSFDFSPDPDQVDYDTLSSGDETVSESTASSLDLSGDDIIIGGDGDDTIDGGGGVDTISGGEGTDTIDGGSGDDTIFGGTGDDTIDGGDDNDTLVGGSGDDSINGGAGGDDVVAGTGEDTIDGGAGADTIDGGAGLDTIEGGAGDDTIAGGEGSDVIAGGAGDDTIFGDEFLPEVGSDFYYVGNAYVTGENFQINGAGSFVGPDVTEFEILTDPVTIRFLDNDVTLEGDDGSNEVPADSTQSVEIDGVEYTANIDYTQTFQDADGTEYNFIILDIDFDGDGIDNGPNEDGYVLIQVSGPALLPGTILDTPSNFANISSIDYNDLVRTTVFNDSIDGGDGNDTIDGERGDDAITVGRGDTAVGGADADTFTLDFDQTSSTGSTTINIDGSTTEQDGVDNDSLNLTGFGAFTLTETVDADGDSTSGTAIYANGNTVNFTEIENLAVCFSKGTQIKVEDGIRAIETLEVGDKLVTHDSGLQPIRWIGERTLGAEKLNTFPKLRPIRIKAGVLGDGIPSRDLIVSPQHRIVIRSKISIRMFEAQEVFVPAKHLLELQGVSIAEDMTEVTYFHLLCDNHEIIEAEGALAETLYTGTEAMKAMTPEALEEITLIFGNLPLSNRPLARFTPKGQLAKKLVERHIKNNRAMYS